MMMMMTSRRCDQRYYYYYHHVLIILIIIFFLQCVRGEEEDYGVCLVNEEHYDDHTDSSSSALVVAIPAAEIEEYNINMNNDDNENDDDRSLLLLYQPGMQIQKYILNEKKASLGLCVHHGDDYVVSDAVVVAPVTDNDDDDEIMFEMSNAITKTGPTLEYQCVISDYDDDTAYKLKSKFQGGSHGEIWSANDNSFILKRMYASSRQSGLREIHFGTITRGYPHIATFVESFVSTIDKSLWLVFRNEGSSLRHYLYSKVQTADNSFIIQPSDFWTHLRKDSDGGPALVKELLRQILTGVASLHAAGITHRDLKPSNIIVQKKNRDSFVVKLADFGSALDDSIVIENLYNNEGGGPSEDEETQEYQPPEVIFSKSKIRRTTSYDMWSVGIIFLEMFFGDPAVMFSPSDATKARLQKVVYKSAEERRKALLLHTMAEFCLFRPTDNDNVVMNGNDHSAALVMQYCNMGTFNTTIMKKDPLGVGMTSDDHPWGVHLLWQMLQWDPSRRISASEALSHAYFTGPYKCVETGREFGTLGELKRHEAFLVAQAKLLSHSGRMLDERVVLPTEYKCPNCSRIFTSYDSCNQHVLARKHFTTSSSFCQYNITSTSNNNTHHNIGSYEMAGRRPYMEDRIVTFQSPKFNIYAVLDGHTGLGTVSYLQQHLVNTTIPFISKLKTGDNQETKLVFRELFQTLHDMVLRNTDFETDFSGSTLTLVIQLDGTTLFIANVGDSTAILLNNNITTTTLSTDHLPNDAMERQRIESSGGFVEFIGVYRVVGQLAISRSIGDHHLRQYVSAEPSVSSVTLLNESSPQFLVIGTDGIWDVMTIEEVSRFIKEKLHNTTPHHSLNQIALDIVYECYIRGSVDNMAILIVSL